jgi:formylglycine-generating enzyme
MTITRNAGAKYVIPTENEWYKAAYYKGGPNAGYWQYPTQNDGPPSNVLSPSGTNNSNFWDYCHVGNGGYTDPTNYLTAVGAFAGSPGAYGTFDMGGLVWQWNEAVVTWQWGEPGMIQTDSARGLRGDSFCDYHHYQASWGRLEGDPSDVAPEVGFRIALVPEPATLSLLALGGLLIARRRRT